MGKIGKIVIVDDEKLIATSISEFLCKRGFDALFFTDPQEFLRRIKKKEFEVSILVTDQNMPFATGMELAREVKGIFPGVKIILFSGVPISPTDWQSAGCDCFFEKPLSLRVLATTVAKLLEKR